MAAISTVLLSLRKNADHIVMNKAIYVQKLQLQDE